MVNGQTDAQSSNPSAPELFFVSIIDKKKQQLCADYNFRILYFLKRKLTIIMAIWI